jgi:hypothetical protein
MGLPHDVAHRWVARAEHELRRCFGWDFLPPGDRGDSIALLARLERRSVLRHYFQDGDARWNFEPHVRRRDGSLRWHANGVFLVGACLGLPRPHGHVGEGERRRREREGRNDSESSHRHPPWRRLLGCGRLRSAQPNLRCDHRGLAITAFCLHRGNDDAFTRLELFKCDLGLPA